MTNPIFDRYRDHADVLGKKFNQIDAGALYDHVREHLPIGPTNILDIGAGSGRDAFYFASLGHCVAAIEPVKELALQGAALTKGQNVTWASGQLPDLESTALADGQFGAVIMSAIWQHVDPEHRAAALSRISTLMAPVAKLIMSLRHDDNPSDQEMIFDPDPDGTIELARQSGLALVDRIDRVSMQKTNVDADITWTWLVFENTKDFEN